VTRVVGLIIVLILAFTIETFAASQATAQESKNSSQADPCAGSPTDETMWNCRHEQLDRSAADLEAIIGELIAGYGDDPERGAALKAAHESWIRFRDAECRLLTIDSASGTMFDLYWASCLTEQNVHRIAQMRWLAEHP
jgi:uncharacterized protein YecT (DUF1311 family)